MFGSLDKLQKSQFEELEARTLEVSQKGKRCSEEPPPTGILNCKERDGDLTSTDGSTLNELSCLKSLLNVSWRFPNLPW